MRDLIDTVNALCMAERQARASIAAIPCCPYGATKAKTVASPCWACICERPRRLRPPSFPPRW